MTVIPASHRYHHHSRDTWSQTSARLVGVGVSVLAAMLHNNNSIAAADSNSVQETSLITDEQKPQSLDQLRANPIAVLFRMLWLFFLFVPCLLTYPVTFGSAAHEKWLRLLVPTLETAGPTFIKLGQWASTRPDIFSPATVRALSRLHHDVTPESSEIVRETLRQALQDFETRNQDQGTKISLTDFEDRPVGAGCIAQVHRARLGTGELVAVKIRRNDVATTIACDLEIMRGGAEFLDMLPGFKPLRLPETFECFAKFMAGQVSFFVEAEHLKKFARNFKNEKHVRFPTPILALDSVLVETFENGETLSSILARNATISDKVGQRVLDCFLKMTLVDNFVHSDLHPGNILVDAADTNSDITVLDAGLVTTLTETDRRNFIDLVSAVALGEGRKAADLLVVRGHNEGRVRDIEKFRDEMETLVNENQAMQLSKVKIGAVLNRMMTLVQAHNVHLDPNFANLVISIVVIEGVGRQLGPNINLFQRMIPLLPKMQREYRDVAIQIASQKQI